LNQTSENFHFDVHCVSTVSICVFKVKYDRIDTTRLHRTGFIQICLM
jgi:hypothetical protein